jgi:hypothetical protein
LGEGWYGVSRPAEVNAPPPPSRGGRKQLYTTVAVKEGVSRLFNIIDMLFFCSGLF